MRLQFQRYRGTDVKTTRDLKHQIRKLLTGYLKMKDLVDISLMTTVKNRGYQLQQNSDRSGVVLLVSHQQLQLLQKLPQSYIMSVFLCLICFVISGRELKGREKPKEVPMKTGKLSSL